MNETSAARPPAQQVRTYQQRERRVLNLVLSLTLPLTLALVLFLPTPLGPVFRLFGVPSGSMEPTLRPGSIVIVSQAAYGYSRFSFESFELPISGRWPSLVPQRGDVIVFRLPFARDVIWVSRVIGFPGDRIQMIDGRLFINGQLVPRETAPKILDPVDHRELDVHVERLPEGVSYPIVEANGDTGRYDNTQEFVVPPDHLFALSDHRDGSADSRDPTMGFGFLPIELVIGPVVAAF